MSNFEEKMFGFLTEENNFESAFEIYQKSPIIIDRLKKEFWELVSQKLKEKCKKDWIFYPEEENEIGLYLKEWKDGIGNGWKYRIGYSDIYNNLWYGLFIDENCKKRKFDLNKVEQFGNIQPRLKDMEGIENFWKKDTTYNFNDIHTLKRILPHNKEEFATQLAETLFDFAHAIKEDIPKMNKLVKK